LNILELVETSKYMKKILITGGTGFAGSHLLERLLELGEKDIHLTSFKGNDQFAENLIPKSQIHKLDLTDYQATLNLIEELKPDEIYHLASLSNVGNSFEKRKALLNNHLNLQLNLLTAVKTASPQSKILAVSTAYVYQETNKKLDENAPLGPSNPYAASKLIQDVLAYSFAVEENLDIVRVRPFNHIGERQAPGFAVSDFAMQIAKIEAGKQDKISVGNLEAIRDFTDVKDMVNAYIKVMEKGEKNEVYNIGSGLGYSIQEILEKLIAQAKTKIRIEIDPKKIRAVDLPYLVCNNKKVRKLGWKTQHQIDETLGRVLDYWRENI